MCFHLPNNRRLFALTLFSHPVLPSRAPSPPHFKFFVNSKYNSLFPFRPALVHDCFSLLAGGIVKLRWRRAKSRSPYGNLSPQFHNFHSSRSPSLPDENKNKLNIITLQVSARQRRQRLLKLLIMTTNMK